MNKLVILQSVVIFIMVIGIVTALISNKQEENREALMAEIREEGIQEGRRQGISEQILKDFQESSFLQGYEKAKVDIFAALEEKGEVNLANSENNEVLIRK